MEDYLLQTIEETKIQLDTSALIKIAVILCSTAAILIALSVLYKKLRIKFEKEHEIRRIQIYRISFRVTRILVILSCVIAVLQAIGIRLTGLSASFGVIILLIALAVKDALQDVFAGIVIMTDKYFSVGDAVEYEGKDGIVTSFTARTTKIEYLDDHSVLSVANRNISKIRKLTHLVDVDLPLPYELSGKDAYTVLTEICRKIKTLRGVEGCELKGTQDFGASAIYYKIRFFCEPRVRLDVRRAVLKTIQDELEIADIHIPYQQIDIHER